MRIALVVSDLKQGGKEHFVVDLANALCGVGIDPMIICLETAGALHGKIDHRNVKLIEMKKRAGNDLRLPFRLAKTLQQEHVQVVHSNNWGTLVESVMAARIAGIHAVVHTQHGLDYGRSASRSPTRDYLRTKTKRLVSRWVRHIVAVSREVLETVVSEWHVPAENVRVIHNGVHVDTEQMEYETRVDRRQRLGFGETDFIIGTVGIFRPVKDLPNLVQAMAAITPRMPQAKLVLVGDGPARRDVEAAVDRFGLRAFVRFLGMRSDARELLPLMDLFVQSSISEGVSLSVLEAMGAGLPIVATRVGGNPEIIQEGKTGILVARGAPDQTAEAVVSLIEDPARRKTMGLLGRERVKTHFSVERMVRDYKSLYAEVRY